MMVNLRRIKDGLSIKSIQQFIRYLITGSLAFIVEYSFFYLLDRLNFWYVYSNSIAMICGFLLSFFLNRNWSFKSKRNTKKQFIMYGVLFLINIGISNGLMFVFVEKLYIQPVFSKLLAIGALVCWNFFIYKKLIFK